MTKKEEADAENAKAAAKANVKLAGPRIYIGPSLKGTITGTVYKTALAPALEEAIKELPAISELVVPLEHLTAANRELSEPDSVLRRIYKMAEDYKRGE